MVISRAIHKSGKPENTFNTALLKRGQFTAHQVYAINSSNSNIEVVTNPQWQAVFSAERLSWKGLRKLTDWKALSLINNGKCLKRAIELVQLVNSTHYDKADVFWALAVLIERETKGSWQASLADGTDGSCIFLGGSGEVLVIAPTGQLFKGKLQSGSLVYVSNTLFRPQYNRLNQV